MNTTNAGDGDLAAAKTAFPILAAISVCHLLNDMMQSLLPAIYPILKSNYGLDFGQIGILTFTFQFTASVLQPMIGFYIDRKPKPYSRATGMGLTLSVPLPLAYAHDFQVLLFAAALVGAAPRSFTRNHRAWRAWRRAGGTGWRNPCFRWAATPVPRLARCSPRSSFCATGNPASPGFH